MICTKMPKIYIYELAKVEVTALKKSIWQKNVLEALPVHDGWARFVILLLRDPHLLEGC